ncbi:hypothetical protein FE257_008432 [Aspergillus nanangensis]|uniref:Uncharacterized protein n=1 Tax=Aspergillus nanangensis TaxID=2582783 RepID=A0AAD4GSN2_ASPNN|nr:hypothetical protein FE257_008432 [Aspergillus nanangensis]
MPVTLKTANHAARRWASPSVSSVEQLLHNTSPKGYQRCKRIIQSSLTDQVLEENHVSASDNGFVRAVFEAYGYHHHLTLRPEDLWFAILSQLSLYINAHADELRRSFVPRQDQVPLKIQHDIQQPLDFGDLAVRMTDSIATNVVDPQLRSWILPAFSTTTPTDRVVAAVLFMGALQKHHKYVFEIRCGIPTVTLLGERNDWALLESKVDTIFSRFGKEPGEFAALLRPVLRRFVASFDNSRGADVLRFWRTCVHHRPGQSSPDTLSGWITAFCFWDYKGRRLNEEGEFCHVYDDDSLSVLDGNEEDEFCHVFHDDDSLYVLDGVSYHRVPMPDIPSACASVAVDVSFTGKIIKSRMVAGLVGIRATSSGQKVNGSIAPRKYDSLQPRLKGRPGTEEPGLDSIQPYSGWWVAAESVEAEAFEAAKRKVKDGIKALDAMDKPNQRYWLPILYKKLGELRSF